MRPGFPSTQSSQGALLFSTLLPVNRTSHSIENCSSFPTVQENAVPIPALSASDRSGPRTARPSADDRRLMLPRIIAFLFLLVLFFARGRVLCGKRSPAFEPTGRVTQSLVDPSSLLRDN